MTLAVDACWLPDLELLSSSMLFLSGRTHCKCTRQEPEHIAQHHDLARGFLLAVMDTQSAWLLTIVTPLSRRFGLAQRCVEREDVILARQLNLHRF